MIDSKATLQVGAILKIMALAACSSSAGPSSLQLCRDVVEVEVIGCAVVEGSVWDSAGSPVAGVIVGARQTEDVPCCTTSYTTTGLDGGYSLEVQLLSYNDFSPRTDTATIFVHVQHPDLQLSDSTAVVLKFGPLGEVPPVTRVDLTVQGWE